MKWKKNQFGGRKVVGQATLLLALPLFDASKLIWAQKVGGQLPVLPKWAPPPMSIRQ